MTPQERETLEHQAERCLRRGELSEAFSTFKQIAAAFPADAAIKRRIDDLQDSLQPSELMDAKSNFRRETGSGQPTSLIDEAEMNASKGDYKGAISIYRQLMEGQPGSELIRERLAELFQLAQAGQPPPKASASQRPLDSVLNDLLSRINDRRKR